MLIFVPMIPGFLFAFGAVEPARVDGVCPDVGQQMMITDLSRRGAVAAAAPSCLSVDHRRDAAVAGWAANLGPSRKRCCGEAARDRCRMAAESSR